VNEIGDVERSDFLAWYDSQKSDPIYDNRRVLEKYCQDDMQMHANGEHRSVS